MLYSPLEQFQILPLGFFIHPWFCITNASIIILFSLGFFFLYHFFIYNTFKTYIVPSRWIAIIENIYIGLTSICKENLGKDYIFYFPFIFILSLFVLVSNLFGLIPFSFTTTSHLILSLSLALSVFGGVNILLFSNYGLKAFSLFIPSGTSFGLAFLLVPIEIVSFIFKPLSLAVRLFANIIAGHTLLKVIAGFSWLIMQKGSLFFFAHFLPLFVLVLLIGLELGVSLIQAYVFSILVCIYLREAIHIH